MTALFLKYRPQTFTDLVGQDAVRKTLKNALKTEKPSHAYLFCGSRGTGKTSTARIFAKGLNCENMKDGDPCGTCDICVDTANGNLIDVFEIDAASNRGIDEIRDLREKIAFAPNQTKRKVYIIDEVHMLTKEAFNALLKTLEEPPDHAFFCLATTEMHKIPETILSRCQVFQFERFTLPQLKQRLQKICEAEDFETEESALEIIGKKAEGGLRDAISLLEQVAAETENKITEAAVRESLGISDAETLENLFQSILEHDTEGGLNVLKNISKKGGDFRTFGHDFLGFLREKMFKNLGKEELKMILRSIEEVEKALFRLKTSPIVELPLEIAVINLTAQTETEMPLHNKSLIRREVTTVKKSKVEVKTPPTKETKKEEPNKDVVFEEPTPSIEKEAEISVSTENITIDVQSITSKMEEIAQKAGIAIFAKKSFLTTTPEVQENKIVFYTDSEFHREKLSATDVFMKIKKSIADLFEQDMEIEFIKKAPKSNNDPFKQSSGTNSKVDANDFLTF